MALPAVAQGLVSTAGFVLYSNIGKGIAGLFQNVANSL